MSSPKKSPKAKKEKFTKVDTKKGIYTVLKQVHPDTGMNSEASAAMKSYIKYAMGKFGDFELFHHLGYDYLIGRIHEFFPTSLATNAVNEVKRAKPAGTVFRGGITKCYYVIFEYLAAELLETSGNVARDNKKTRITKYFLDLAIVKDEELYKIYFELLKPKDAFTFKMPPRKEYKKMLRPYECDSMNISHKQFAEDLKLIATAEAKKICYGYIMSTIFNLLPSEDKIDTAIASLDKSGDEEKDDTKPLILYKRLVNSIHDDIRNFEMYGNSVKVPYTIMFNVILSMKEF